jgi:hypothetical protein
MPFRPMPRRRLRLTSVLARQICGGALALACLCGAAGGGGAPAQAQMIYRLLPAVGVGITDNAASAPAATSTTVAGGGPQRDEFGMAGVTASARYTRALSIHSLDASLVYTQYLHGRGPPTLTAGLGWSSTFKLSTAFDLNVGADAGLSRTSTIATTDLSTTLPTTYSASDSYYLSTTAHETLTFTPTARQVYAETVSASRVSYINDAAGLPATTVITAKLHASWLFTRDTLFLEGTVADAHIAAVPEVVAPDGTVTTVARDSGQVIFAELLAGWQHELGVTWTSKLSAGPLAIIQSGLDTAYNYGVVAELDYHVKPWFASLTASQAPVPNLYIGAVTLNDEIVARAALPLTASELTLVSGYAGYLYSRIADADGTFHHAFDTRTAGAALTRKFRNRPFALSLLYTITDQKGVSIGGLPALDLERQTLMLTLTGIFAWGPGTLPLLQGGLEPGGA